MRRPVPRTAIAVFMAASVMSLAFVGGAGAQGTGEPSPTIATTEPEVPAQRSEEMSSTETRLRTIVVALAALGVAIVVSTIVFWGLTRPARGSDVGDEESAELPPLLPPVVEAASPTTDPVPGPVAASAGAPSPEAASAGDPIQASPVAPGIDSSPPPAPEVVPVAVGQVAATTPDEIPVGAPAGPDSPPAEVIDPEALDAARSLFERLGSVPDMER